MNKHAYDLCVIGGGINGCGIARDAAGRGLKVLLLEMEDLGSATSSASTKLIHGGLRYLEFFEFGLVRESLKERDILLKAAPHIIWPMRFILPHTEGQRPAWMIRLGLFLYDHLGGKTALEKSKFLSLSSFADNVSIQNNFKAAFQYSDCWVEDSRLVVLNAMDARDKGADIRPRTKCHSITAQNQHWEIKTDTGEVFGARSVINAAGPWVSRVLDGSSLDKHTPHVRLVKGSHIIVPKQYQGDQAFLLQQSDGRVVFIIPYEGDFTLVGTTEENYQGDAAKAKISESEKEYLIGCFNGFFENNISTADIVHTYSGVRPLFDDGQGESRKVTRDFKLHYHRDQALPLISVYGGKLTTYRTLSEKAVDLLLKISGQSAHAWTEHAALPGGDMGCFAAFLDNQKKRYPFLPGQLLYRYARSYGTLMDVLLGGAREIENLGERYGDDVYEAEISYLIEYEFASTLDDILWRRSKLGLHISKQTMKKLEKRIGG